ncbi:MAG TPA: arginine deiminase family protein [Solirubrobacteraceae bacterium]|nr:arginine deiminase family protein [Solirubrobacteraceae bacterium]
MVLTGAATAPAERSAERRYGSQSMIAPLRHVLVHPPGDEYNARLWRAYGLPGEPDVERARAQHAEFVRILELHGVRVDYLDEGTSVQSAAVYDPALITDEGAVILRSGRPERRAEAMPMARKLLELEIPIIGWLRGEAELDGGDTLWLDERTLLVACGYRSNEAGLRQLRAALDGLVDEWHRFELPHWEGPGKVLHLMSVVNLVSERVALVYPRAMPHSLHRLLLERGYTLIQCPEEEFDTQGCNVLTLAPGQVVICAGNPVTSARLRDAGVEVIEYEGDEISIARISGPTCNTRPLLRG